MQKNNHNINNMCSEKQQAEIVGYGKQTQSDKTLELCICGL